jgi:hypothetical protein
VTGDRLGKIKHVNVTSQWHENTSGVTDDNAGTRKISEMSDDKSGMSKFLRGGKRQDEERQT